MWLVVVGVVVSVAGCSSPAPKKAEPTKATTAAPAKK